MSVSAPTLDELLARAAPAGLAVIDGFELTSLQTAAATPGTLFQAGSVSKLVAALVALRLVETGVLDLDAPLRGTATLRRLLGHTAGFGVEFFPGYPQGAAVPTLAQVVAGEPPAVTPPVVVEAEPGAGFRYSGGGYAILQLFLEDLLGRPFHELATELVLEPLGMASSTFEQPLPERLRGLAASEGWNVYPEAAAAGLWTTAADLARVVLALQHALADRPGPLSSETAALMVGPGGELPEEGQWTALREVGLEPPDRFGLGLFLDERRFSHLGGTEGFFCGIWGALSGGTGAALMTGRPAGPDFFDIVLAVAEERGWPGFRAAA